MIRTIAGLLIATVCTIAIAQAPANPPVRIRGVVEKLDGQMLTIKARNGQTVVVKLADNFVVMGIEKASIADIDSGKFIGTTTVGERQGNLWVAANQSDEIVVVNAQGKAIAKLGDFDGVAGGMPVHMLFPASLRFHGTDLLVTNLSLNTHLFGFNTVDTDWSAQVSRYTVVRIRARIP